MYERIFLCYRQSPRKAWKLVLSFLLMVNAFFQYERFTILAAKFSLALVNYVFSIKRVGPEIDLLYVPQRQIASNLDNVINQITPYEKHKIISMRLCKGHTILCVDAMVQIERFTKALIPLSAILLLISSKKINISRPYIIFD